MTMQLKKWDAIMKNKILVASAVIIAVILIISGLFYFNDNYKVQVVQKTYTVTIDQIGLPLDMNWTMSQSNQPSKFVSSSSPVILHLKDGTYSFLPLASYSTYYPSSEVNITVSGSNVTTIVTFNAIPQSVISINLEVNYLGTTSGYFGPSSQSISDSGVTYDEGFKFTEAITLKSSAIVYDHNISSITTNTPGFSIISTSPVLPVDVSPGGSVTIGITILTPPGEYSGVLDLEIDTY